KGSSLQSVLWSICSSPHRYTAFALHRSGLEAFREQTASDERDRKRIPFQHFQCDLEPLVEPDLGFAVEISAGRGDPCTSAVLKIDGAIVGHVVGTNSEPPGEYGSCERSCKSQTENNYIGFVMAIASGVGGTLLGIWGIYYGLFNTDRAVTLL